LIYKVIQGLAKRKLIDQVLPQNQDYFEQLVQRYSKNHSKNIRGMTAQILEKVFVSHAEQGRVSEVKKLIYSSMFLKSVVICACEVEFFLQNEKEMQIYTLIEIIDQPPFDLWRILNIFLKLYPEMPTKLNN
jgi:hypothetical protein